MLDINNLSKLSINWYLDTEFYAVDELGVDVTDQNEKKWHVSFNAHLINKTPPKDKKYFAEGFGIFKVSMDDFIEVISKGFAFSYVYQDDVRKGVNFAFTDCLCVDVDGGFSLTEAEEHPFVKAHASFIYTTA